LEVIAMIATTQAPRSGHPLRTIIRAIARLCAFICSERFARAQLQIVDVLSTLYPVIVAA